MYAIGIDIGGTKIAGALVSADGSIIRDARIPTPAHDANAIAEAVVELVNELAEGVEVEGVGVAAAGFVDADRAKIVYAPNLSWRNEPFKENCKRKSQHPYSSTMMRMLPGGQSSDSVLVAVSNTWSC